MDASMRDPYPFPRFQNDDNFAGPRYTQVNQLNLFGNQTLELLKTGSFSKTMSVVVLGMGVLLLPLTWARTPNGPPYQVRPVLMVG